MSVPAWVAQAVTQISTFKGLATHPFARDTSPTAKHPQRLQWLPFWATASERTPPMLGP